MNSFGCIFEILVLLGSNGSQLKNLDIWRPLHIDNSVLVYSNSLWRWRQRCQGSLINTRYSSNLDPPQNLSEIKKSLAENTYGDF